MTAMALLLLVKFPTELNHLLLAVVEARAQVPSRALIKVAGLLIRLHWLGLHLLSQRRRVNWNLVVLTLFFEAVMLGFTCDFPVQPFLGLRKLLRVVADA